MLRLRMNKYYYNAPNSTFNKLLTSIQLLEIHPLYHALKALSSRAAEIAYKPSKLFKTSSEPSKDADGRFKNIKERIGDV